MGMGKEVVMGKKDVLEFELFGEFFEAGRVWTDEG